MKLARVLFILFLLSWGTLATHASPMLATNNPLYLPLVTANNLEQIAYTRYNSGSLLFSKLYLANVDGTGEIRLSDADAYAPTWSPDGTRLAFVCPDADPITFEKQGGLCTIKADGTEQTKLSLSSVLTTIGAPAWSPDGTQIVFSASSIYDTITHLYSLTLTDSRLRQLTSGSNNDNSPTWSPDGTQIAFDSQVNRISHIFVMRADGTDQHPLTDGSSVALKPSWSPDGTRLLWYRNNFVSTAIMVMNVDGTSQQPLLEMLPSSGNQVFYPVWSRDGREIVYTVSGPSPTYPVQIYRMNQDGTGSRRITIGQGPAWRPVPRN